MKEITLKIKDIKEYILENFRSFIAVDGFLYKKSHNEFFCQEGDCTYIFNLLLTSWSNSYSISIRLFINQNKIESIYKTILEVHDANPLTFYQDMIERIYYSPDGRKIVKGEDMGIWIAKNDDMSNIIKLLKKYYTEIAKPYFNNLKTLDMFDDFMNNPPFEYSPAYVGCNTDERCMKGLIVAKLVNNPDYKRLVATYDELIKKTKSEESINNYNKVKNYLEQNIIS